MKREVLFRAYHKNFKRMLPVVSMEYDANGVQVVTVDNRGVDGKYDVIPYCSRYIEEDKDFPIDTLVLMQSTGLKDKNGTKIFEGDILEISIKDSDDKIEYKLGVVEFSTRSLEYIIRSKEGIVYGFNSILNSAGFYEFELEIVGNIYDNKDLLHIH